MNLNLSRNERFGLTSSNQLSQFTHVRRKAEFASKMFTDQVVKKII